MVLQKQSVLEFGGEEPCYLDLVGVERGGKEDPIAKISWACSSCTGVCNEQV